MQYVDALRKTHTTTLEVNLSALAHNLNVYRGMLRPNTRIMAMVKAAGYGSGAVEVARCLETNGIDYLSVAYADEGVELREAGITVPIMVLNPSVAQFEACLHFDLEPELYNVALLEHFCQYTVGRDQIKVHLKMDTGMHRLGFCEADLRLLAPLFAQHPQVRVVAVLSHLAASDMPAHDAFTQGQAALLEKMHATLSDMLGYVPLRHLCNTGGISRFPDYHFEMVRLGIGLYGADSNPEVRRRLRTVNTLKTTISQIRTVSDGETVGYSRNGPIHAPTRVATLGIGYADGMLRKTGNGRYSVYLHGQLAPTIGNICMDMCMIDITHIPEAQEGDGVEIFGVQQPVERLAQCLETIPYEVFTGIAARVRRTYV